MAVAHRIYAEALLEAAREQGGVPEVRDQYAVFVQALEQSPELGEMLRNPQVDPRAKRAALESALEGANPSFLNFLRLLAEKNRIGEVEDVHAEWERLLAAEERVLTLELTTAVELSDDDAAAIVRQIEEAAGRRVEATRSVDPDLIGGLVLQAGSLRVDGSVKGRLESLRQELLSRA